MNPALAARAAQVRAEIEHKRAIREFHARRRRDEQARVGALMQELIALIAGVVEENDQPSCVTCLSCRHALAPRIRNCPHCGAVVPLEGAA